MKILFIDGHFTHNGWRAIRKRGVTKCGEYVNNTTEDFKMVNNREVILRRKKDKTITVVRQKSKWDTFKILCHELAHWLFDFLPNKLEDKFDDWLDRD